MSCPKIKSRIRSILKYSRFNLWATHKYKKVMEFDQKPLLYDKNVMHTDDMITYGLLAQESLREYSNFVNSKQVDLKSRHSGNNNGSERGSFAKSDGKCHKCGKKGHIQK